MTSVFDARVTAGLAVLVACSTIAAAGETQSVRGDGYRQWVGAWVLSVDVNRALGYAGAEDRRNATWSHPASFRIEIDASLGESVDRRTLDAYRDQVFRRNGHRVVATGKWETTFADGAESPGSDCFVTRYEGSTFLGCEAPYVAIYGGRVSFLQGRDRAHDVLVVDFDSFRDRLAGGTKTFDTVAYQRLVGPAHSSRSSPPELRESRTNP